MSEKLPISQNLYATSEEAISYNVWYYQIANYQVSFYANNLFEQLQVSSAFKETRFNALPNIFKTKAYVVSFIPRANGFTKCSPITVAIALRTDDIVLWEINDKNVILLYFNSFDNTIIIIISRGCPVEGKRTTKTVIQKYNIPSQTLL